MERNQFKDFWESQTTPLHAHKQELWYDRYAQEIKNFLPEQGVVVDAGCGSGEILERLSRYYRKMIGVDYSESMLTQAKQKKYENQVVFFNDSIINIKTFCAYPVDAIYCNGVVQYLSHEEFAHFIADSLSLLSNKGKLIILQIPNVNCRTLFRLGFYQHEKAISFNRILKGMISLTLRDLINFLKTGSTKMEDGIGNWYSIEEVRELVRPLGASVEVHGSVFVNYSYRFHVVISKN